MVDFNTAGQAQLDGIDPACIRWMAWLDIAGDVIRVTTAPYPLTFSGTGDPDLDGNTFGRTDGLVSVSEVTQDGGGAKTVTAYLSGLQGIDTTTLAQIGDRTNYQARAARLWVVILDRDVYTVVSIKSYYSGFMVGLRIAMTSQAATIALEIEGFLASMTDASGRTYLGQAEFDAADTSAAATIAAAGGISAATAGMAVAAGGSGFKDGFNPYDRPA